MEQNPEMMAEAKKMMESPEYQSQMKKMTQSKEFKDSLKKTSEMMNDPTRAAESEARYEHMMKVGDNELKKAAGSAMEDAMAAMSNPEVMAQMTSMIKDPNFQAQLAEMTKDPSFRSYIEAVSFERKRKKKQQQSGKKRKYWSHFLCFCKMHFCVFLFWLFFVPW